MSKKDCLIGDLKWLYIMGLLFLRCFYCTDEGDENNMNDRKVKKYLIQRNKLGNNIMSEKIEEYESIRNELITIEELQRNVWIYMYVLFCAIFVLGFEWSYNLFLATYVILIPFQCIINDYRWSISKMSTYIRIFFEKDYRDMNWESFHVCSCYKNYDNQRKKSIRCIIGMSSSIHLGFLATGFYCNGVLKELYSDNKFILGAENIFFIIISIVLFIVLVALNRGYYANYDGELEDVIKKYKKEIKESNVY